MSKAVSPGVVAVMIIVVLAVVGYFAWKTLGGKAPSASSATSPENYSQIMQRQMEQQRNAQAQHTQR